MVVGRRPLEGSGAGPSEAADGRAHRSASGPALLEARSLVVQRGGRLVLDVDQFALADHETVAVVGPNGAGKSTLLLAMAALIRPSEGQLLLRGALVTPRGALRFRRRIGLVLADPLLLDTTVHKNVAAGLRFRGVRGREVTNRVDAWLDRLGVLGLRDRPARELSSGEAQRVSLARAMVLDPEVLLLDEPFASVDVEARAQLVDDTEQLLRETQRACLLVTHDLDEASRLGTRMSVVVQGRLRQEDVPHRVLTAPVDPEVASFVGVETRWAGTVLSARDGSAVVDVEGLRVEVATVRTVGRRVLCCLRAEDVTLRAMPTWDALSPQAGTRNILRGRVLRLSPKGPVVRVSVDCGPTLVATVTRQSTIEMGLQVGDAVEASFSATAVHVIDSVR